LGSPEITGSPFALWLGRPFSSSCFLSNVGSSSIYSTALKNEDLRRSVGKSKIESRLERSNATEEACVEMEALSAKEPGAVCFFFTGELSSHLKVELGSASSVSRSMP